MSYAEIQLIEMEFYDHAIPYMASTSAAKEIQRLEGNLYKVIMLASAYEGQVAYDCQEDDESGPRGPDKILK